MGREPPTFRRMREQTRGSGSRKAPRVDGRGRLRRDGAEVEDDVCVHVAFDC